MKFVKINRFCSVHSKYKEKLLKILASFEFAETLTSDPHIKFNFLKCVFPLFLLKPVKHIRREMRYFNGRNVWMEFT